MWSRFQQLQVYLGIIRTDKEKRRKEKTFAEHGLGQADIERALGMDETEAGAYAAKEPCERIVVLVAYLAEFHNGTQLEELVKLEDEAGALLKDARLPFCAWGNIPAAWMQQSMQ